MAMVEIYRRNILAVNYDRLSYSTRFIESADRESTSKYGHAKVALRRPYTDGTQGDAHLTTPGSWASSVAVDFAQQPALDLKVP